MSVSSTRPNADSDADSNDGWFERTLAAEI
jgi:hypothetical protein